MTNPAMSAAATAPAADRLASVSDLTPGADLDAALRGFAADIRGLDPVAREISIRDAAATLKANGVTGASKLIDVAIRADRPRTTATTREVKDELWPTPVTTSALLDSITAAIKAYLVLPDQVAEAIALWIAATHVFTQKWPWDFFPIVSITSPVMRCGKSLLLDVLYALSPKAVLTSNISASALYRLIASRHPVVLIDEYDSVASEEARESLRGLLNSAFQRGRPAIRCVGKNADLQVEEFDTFGPCAVAAIGHLPGTVSDRAITIRLKRKTANEIIERFDAEARGRLKTLRSMARRWAADLDAGDLTLLDAAMLDADLPAELSDRGRDIWRPLLVIAMAAGDGWAAKGKTAAKTLAADPETVADSSRTSLLAEIKKLFEDRRVDRLFSKTIIEALTSDEGGPWAEYRHGKPLTAPTMARLLGPLGIMPQSIRIEGDTGKGYYLEKLKDSFLRYLPPDQTVTASQRGETSPESENCNVTKPTLVTATNLEIPGEIGTCDGVTDRIRGEDEKKEKNADFDENVGVSPTEEGEVV